MTSGLHQAEHITSRLCSLFGPAWSRHGEAQSGHRLPPAKNNGFEMHQSLVIIWTLTATRTQTCKKPLALGLPALAWRRFSDWTAPRSIGMTMGLRLWTSLNSPSKSGLANLFLPSNEESKNPEPGMGDWKSKSVRLSGQLQPTVVRHGGKHEHNVGQGTSITVVTHFERSHPLTSGRCLGIV